MELRGTWRPEVPPPLGRCWVLGPGRSLPSPVGSAFAACYQLLTVNPSPPPPSPLSLRSTHPYWLLGKLRGAQSFGSILGCAWKHRAGLSQSPLCPALLPQEGGVGVPGPQSQVTPTSLPPPRNGRISSLTCENGQGQGPTPSCPGSASPVHGACLHSCPCCPGLLFPLPQERTLEGRGCLSSRSPGLGVEHGGELLCPGRLDERCVAPVASVPNCAQQGRPQVHVAVLPCL